MVKPVQEGYDLVADACLPRKYVDSLRDLGYSVLYINETERPSMPDSEVKAIARHFNIPVATCNVKHFLDVDNLIPLRPRKAKQLVRETLKYLE